jgi:hypothetical protein
MGCQPQCFFGHFFGNALHFIENSAWSNNCHPALRGSLSFAHPNFGGLFCIGFIRKDSDPDSPSPFDVSRHSDPGGLNLFRSQSATMGGLQSVFPEIQARSPARYASHFTFLLLSIFNLFGT